MRLYLLALFALTVACANPDRRTRDRGDTPLTFTNHSQRDVCSLHLAPADARVWGKSWLTNIAHVGDQTTLHVKPGHYMLRAHACNAQSTVLLLYNVDVTAAREVVLHEPETREPLAPGRTAWPVTRWLSETSDWYYPTGMTSQAYHVTVDNSCAHDLRLRLGPQETTTLPARVSMRLALPAGTAVALLDESQHELTHLTTATGEQHLHVDATCTKLATR